MQARILSFRSSIPTPTSLSPFKHQLPRLHPQPPFRHSTDHHNRHNSNKITLITTIKALSSKILTPTNKTYISPEEVKGSTNKTIQTTQVATSTIPTTTIRDTKVITKTNFSSTLWMASFSSNHLTSKIFKPNHFIQQQQVNLGQKLEICLRYQSILKPPLLLIRLIRNK